ncbi:hypothetical protein AHF37_04818 [Paragonimus kellicotti]|nr:hypothetical protein AHF37_04818 [Paragonimus kellicotti]
MEHVGLLGFPLSPVSETESPQSEGQKLNVYEGNQHMIAMFSPPTADSTPSLYATPLPWDKQCETSEGETLGWRPSPFPVHDWTESDDFEEAMRARRWNPMGTAYQPAEDSPSPDPIRGLPRNPTGRTGVGGKGRLPVWGANPAVIIVLTREQKPKEKRARKTFVRSSDRLRLEYALLVHRVAFQLPWVSEYVCPFISRYLIFVQIFKCTQPSPIGMEHVGLLGFPLSPVSETESPQSEGQKLNVYEGNQHMIAMFSPPTADSTPSLYATPLPWDSETSEGETLGWRPSPFPVHDWTESDDFEEAMRARRWNPMGTAYQPAEDSPSPDPIRGLPRNPTGRTGVGGKGRLPVWGANPAVIIVLTREQKPKEKRARKTFVRSSDRLRLEYALLVHRVAFQLPWFLVRHPSTCNGLDCTKSLVDLFVNKRLEEICQTQPGNREPYEKTAKAYNEAQFQQVWSGYLNDMINTDNAWIEPNVFNVHFQLGETEQTEILRVRSLSSAYQISSVSVCF